VNTTLCAPVARERLLSEQLAELRQRFAERRATLREVIEALGSRAFTLLMIVFALPFVAPVSVPGSSTPLGLVIAVIALQLAFGRLPWLPRWLLDWRLPAGFFTTIVPLTQRLVARIERVLHPRWPQLTAAGSWRAVHLLTLCAAALVLALPMPLPFTNTLPGWAVLLLACGLLERDGAFVAAGHAMFVATLVFFALLGSAISNALIHTWHWIAG
jgi:hypothetical protein